MKELFDIFSLSVLWVGLIGLALIVAIGVFCLCKDAWTIYRLSKKRLIMIPLAVGAIIVGGTKPEGKPKAQIYWDDGLRDNGSEIDTNDLRRITFKWAREDWVPAVAVVRGYAWHNSVGTPTGFDNSIPIFSNVSVTDGQAIVMMEQDATNYVYYVEQSYIPDAPVVTNGVYHIHAVGTNSVWIPIGLTIKEDSRIISPHKEKQ